MNLEDFNIEKGSEDKKLDNKETFKKRSWKMKDEIK